MAKPKGYTVEETPTGWFYLIEGRPPTGPFTTKRLAEVAGKLWVGELKKFADNRKKNQK